MKDVESFALAMALVALPLGAYAAWLALRLRRAARRVPFRADE